MTDLPKTPSFRLDGKRALVTGAGRGIGLAAAAALAEAGAAVTLVSRTGKEIEEGAAAIRARGQKAEAIALDVTDVSTVCAALEKRPPYEVLVNNAGQTKPSPIVDVTEADFDRVFNVNFRAAYFVAQAVVRGLVAAKRPGSIINLSSQLGHVGGGRAHGLCLDQARDRRSDQGDGRRARAHGHPRECAGARPISRRR